MNGSAKVVMTAALIALFTSAVAAPSWAQAPAAGDPVKGETVFKQRCSVCHSIAPGAKSIGPNMLTVAGRKAASLPGFNYSPALKASGLTWDAATLDVFLTSPQKKVKGTAMVMVVPSPKDRADLIAYFQKIKK